MPLGLALAGVANTARADASFSLSWHAKPGTAGCVTEAALRDAVAKKVGQNPFTDPERADIAIEGEEASVGGRFRAHVQQRDRQGVILGSRDLDTESCARLMQATTIVVALFIEPYTDREPSKPAENEDASEPQVREEAPAPPPTLRPPPPATRQAQVLSSVSSRPPFDLSLGVGAALATGLLPSASVALRGAARLEREGSRWSFDWSAGYSLPQSFSTRAVRGTFSAVDQQVRACFAVAKSTATRLDVCGGAFWGAVVPTTTGVHARDDASRTLAGPLAALAAQLGERPRSARLDLGITAPIKARSFYFQSTEAEQERVYVTGKVIVFAGISGLFTIL